MLSNSIALLTLALMLASEARRATGAPRAGLYTLATVIALIALALKPITGWVPAVGTTLTNIFGSPVAWFVLLMGLFFALRPFWTKPPGTKGGGKAARYSNLQSRGWYIAERIRHHRALEWFEWSRGENLLDITRDGLSVLIAYEQAGLIVPDFNGIDSAERVCVGMEQYFSALRPFMRDGHVAQVDGMVASVAERARQTAMAFNPQQWHIDPRGGF
jgi:hypothetical protein